MGESRETEPAVVGDTRFFAILSELAGHHSEMAQRYGIHDAEDSGFLDDPLSSQRYASPDFGVDAWVYALMRANESMRRLQAQVITNELGSDHFRKSFLDLASQAVIALILWEEEREEARSDDEDEPGE